MIRKCRLTFYIMQMIYNFEYFSLVTFTTVGYGDVVVEKGWRIMAGIEALNGILLLGWSTAVLLAVAQRFWRVRDEPN